jgi:hypothetical protein
LLNRSRFTQSRYRTPCAERPLKKSPRAHTSPNRFDFRAGIGCAIVLASSV